jgi:hypothetical protein
MNSRVFSANSHTNAAVDSHAAPSVRELVLDRIGADFDPTTHIALGPWCFAGAEDVYPDWDKLAFIEPFAAGRERCEQAEAVRRLAGALRDELYPEMNRRHGTSYDCAFWHTVLFNWLLHLIMLSWRLWRHVELFVIEVGDEPLNVALPGTTAPISFPDTLAFVNACYRSEDFRGWLVRETIRRQVPPHWRLRADRAAPCRDVTPIASDPEPHRRVGRIDGMRRWHRLLLTAIISARPAARAQFGPLIAGDCSAFPESYREFVSWLAQQTLPKSLRDGFPALDAAARAQTYRPGRVHVLTVNPHDDQANLILAHAVAAGERIVGVQHGGVYGTAALAAYAPDLEYCYDTFVTWGWTKHAAYDGRFLPLPSPMLSRFAKRRRSTGRDLILIGTVMPQFNPRFDYSANPLDYRSWKRRFVSGLTSAVRSDLGYRPDQSEYSIADADWLRRHFRDLPIVQGDLQQAMSSCRLVILDHPGTALAEALAANVPTICFWNREQWLLSPAAQLLFDQLRQADILFDQPEAAAAQVNAVVPNIESWWQMPERQRTRAEWCHSFARADRDWLAQWLRAFATV